MITYRLKIGFTLAEVLITLGIIGVVASLTVPNLISKYAEKQVISKLNKIQYTFSNAYTSAIFENGTPDRWNLDANAEGTQAFFDKIKPNLQISKECHYDNRFDCGWNDSYFYYLNGTKSSEHIHNGYTKTFVLSDGSIGAFYLHSTEVKPNPGCVNNGNYFSCASLLIKTDSSDKQMLGKNVFSFRFEHSRFVPDGLNADMQQCYNIGKKCTAWVVYNKNMDYLNCEGLTWSGQNKCQ